MFMATISEKINADGAVMLTASHLPFNRNGLKFFTKNGGLNKNDITDILNIAESAGPEAGISVMDGKYEGGVEKITSRLKNILSSFTGLDCPF